MRCSQKHAKKLADIYDKVKAQVDRYTESQRKVFHELESLSAFDNGKGFAENLKLIWQLVLSAEEKAGPDKFFPNIRLAVAKLQSCYSVMPEDKKAKLNSENFLSTMSSLAGGLASASGGSLIGEAMNIVDGATSAVDAAVSSAEGAASTGPLLTAMHAVHIAISGFLLCMDIKQFMDLNKMRQDWNKGGDERVELLKNDKFEEEVKMRKLINDIRDQILRESY